MKRLEFHISYLCNHACIFCSEYDRMNSYKNSPLSLIQIKTILIDRRKKGFDHVHFTGGEPTIVPGFLDLLRFSKRLGYTIFIGTNGTMFSSKDFAREALGYIDEFSLSIHGYDAVTMQEQTGNKHHFSILESSIFKNIKKYQKNNFFFANIVLNQKNYRHIIKILKFIQESEYPAEQILISVVAPEGLAEKSYSDVVFDLFDFQKYIPGVVEYCNTHELTVRFFGLPTCLLGSEYLDYSSDSHWEERNTIERFTDLDGKISLVDIFTPDNSRKRKYIKKCSSCVWKQKPCTGIFSKYLDYYSI